MADQSVTITIRDQNNAIQRILNAAKHFDKDVVTAADARNWVKSLFLSELRKRVLEYEKVVAKNAAYSSVTEIEDIE